MTHSKLDPEERARLRRLCEEATPGPLSVHDYGREWLVNNDEFGVYFPGEREADARLYAAARSALPRLLDALEAVERERDAGVRVWHQEIADRERERVEFAGRIGKTLEEWRAAWDRQRAEVLRLRDALEVIACVRPYTDEEWDLAVREPEEIPERILARRALAARTPEGGTDGE